jgi:hypothetical protein
MKLKLEAQKPIWRVDEVITVQLLVLNDSYEPVAVDRRLIIGPNVLPNSMMGFYPISVEPAFSQEEQNLVMLNPFCFYGRQRTFENLAPGQVNFYGYLLNKPVDSLLPQKPGDLEALLTSAEPLVLTIEESS